MPLRKERDPSNARSRFGTLLLLDRVHRRRPDDARLRREPRLHRDAEHRPPCRTAYRNTKHHPRPPIALGTAEACGRTEPHRFYRERLDDEKSAESLADEIATEFAKDDADVKKIMANHPKTADQIPHLKTWLETKLGKKG